MSEVNIGTQIRHYRRAKNMTSKQLAEITGLSPSMISQIENGQANPSINAVKIIAAAIEVPLFQLFCEPPTEESYIVRSDARKRISLPESAGVCYELLTPDLRGSIEYCIMTLAPGEYSAKQLLGHKGEEVGYLLSGSLTLELDTQSYVLLCGDSIRLPAQTPHRWQNHTDEPAQLLFAVTPPSF